MKDLLAVLNACVLVPACLCDTLLRFAESPSLYRPFWSRDILDEVARTLERKIGLSTAQAARRIEQMRLAFPEAQIDGYESLIGRMTNDPKDRHVLAAAVRAGAQTIVTLNQKHFGEGSTSPYGIEIQSPDAYLVHQFHVKPQLAAIKIAEQAAGIGRDIDQILASLSQTTPQFADLMNTALRRAKS